MTGIHTPLEVKIKSEIANIIEERFLKGIRKTQKTGLKKRWVNEKRIFKMY